MKATRMVAVAVTAATMCGALAAAMPAEAATTTVALGNGCQIRGSSFYGKGLTTRWARTDEISGCASIDAEIRYIDYYNPGHFTTNYTGYLNSSHVIIYAFTEASPWSDHNGTHTTGVNAQGFRLLYGAP